METDTTRLSPREQQVLEYLAKGFLYKEISDVLSISYDTVHNHIRHIYEKLHVRSRTQAVARYLDVARPPGTAVAPNDGRTLNTS
jgi:DNA-binding NarL/FixJ family response regulator